MNNKNRQDYDVFISYRHTTGFYMSQIVYTKLISNGYTVFMDKTMNSGKYEEKIHSAINNCRNFIVVLFPDDLEDLKNDESWLNKEAAWALENGGLNIIPVMCDGFEWPRSSGELSDVMNTVKKNNGILIHKDYSLDSDLDNLCDNFLKNVTPTKPRITAIEFFRHNLESRSDLTVSRVDVAFHGGSPWLMPGEKNELLVGSLKKGIPWRVMINTVDAAESIGQHMRDETALYVPFTTIHAQWKKLQTLYPDCLEVRACPIPLIHVHHSVHFVNDTNEHQYGEQHIKYYAYNNTRLDNAFEHRVSSYSKYYSIYSDEFEFLWAQSQKL